MADTVLPRNKIKKQYAWNADSVIKSKSSVRMGGRPSVRVIKKLKLEIIGCLKHKLPVPAAAR
jgi:hypothetical protein